MKKAATEALEKAQEGIKAVLKENPLKINLGIIIWRIRDLLILNVLGGLEAFMDKKYSVKNSLVSFLFARGY